MTGGLPQRIHRLMAVTLLYLSPLFDQVESFSDYSLPRYRVGSSVALKLSGFDFLRHNNHDQKRHHHTTGDRVPQITTIESLDDYLDFLRGNDAEEHNKLTVIKFYASWCKSCAKFGAKYRQLALEEGDQADTDGRVLAAGRVRFAEVEFGANKRMCKSFGIKRLPYVHIHKGKAGKLEDFVCGPSKFQQLIDKVKEYRDVDVDEILLKRELEEGQAFGNDIIQGLQEEQTQGIGMTNSTQSVFRI